MRDNFNFYISDDTNKFLITEEGKVCEFSTREAAERFYGECIANGYLTIEDGLRVSPCAIPFMGDEEFQNCDDLHAWEV